MNWSHGLPQKNLLGVTYPIQFGTFESMMFRLSRFGGISFLEGTSPEYSHVNENSPNYKGKLIFHPPPLFGVQHLNLQAKYVTNGLLGPPLKLVFNLPQTHLLPVIQPAPQPRRGYRETMNEGQAGQSKGEVRSEATLLEERVGFTRDGGEALGGRMAR